MITLTGQKVYLRALEPEDLDFVHAIENDELIWELSHTITPFSKYEIKQYLQNAHRDIYDVKQLRLVICKNNNQSIGMIDIFDFDFKNKRAGIGIIIKNKTDRHYGYGTEALTLLINYCFKQLDLHQLYCNISEDNDTSIKLFSNCGFKTVGIKKDWNYVNGHYKNELLLQLINN